MNSLIRYVNGGAKSGQRTRDFIIDDLIAADYAGTAQGAFVNVERTVSGISIHETNIG